MLFVFDGERRGGGWGSRGVYYLLYNWQMIFISTKNIEKEEKLDG